MNSCCPVVALVAKWLESHCNINYQISHLFPPQFEMLPVINTYVHWGLFLSTFKFILECFYYHFRIFLNIRNSSENWKAHVQASKCKAFCLISWWDCFCGWLVCWLVLHSFKETSDPKMRRCWQILIGSDVMSHMRAWDRKKSGKYWSCLCFKCCY